jgi:hypothetical protein
LKKHWQVLELAEPPYQPQISLLLTRRLALRSNKRWERI